MAGHTKSDVSAEDRAAIALERIAIAVERWTKGDTTTTTRPTGHIAESTSPEKESAAGTLNPPSGPVPTYEPPSVKEPVGTLKEETAKLHAAVGAAAPDPVADLLGETTPERLATFEEARAALMSAAQDPPKGIGPEKVLGVLKSALSVDRLSKIPVTDKAAFGRFLTAIEAATGGRRE